MLWLLDRLDVLHTLHCLVLDFAADQIRDNTTNSTGLLRITSEKLSILTTIHTSNHQTSTFIKVTNNSSLLNDNTATLTLCPQIIVSK
jgi:hypothetical protein